MAWGIGRGILGCLSVRAGRCALQNQAQRPRQDGTNPVPPQTMPPEHDLDKAQQQARNCPAIVVFNGPNTVEIVMGTLGIEDPREAKVFILSLICRLTPDNYSGPFDPMRPPADVYGIFFEGLGWYIKFSMLHGRLHVHSCHPPNNPLRTQTETITRRLR